jgi:hypothetical protein
MYAPELQKTGQVHHNTPIQGNSAAMITYANVAALRRAAFATIAALALLNSAGYRAFAEDAAPRPPPPLDLPGLLCFWDFQEDAGSPRVAKGPHAYALNEMAGPVARTEGGVFGPYSARLKKGQWFSIPRANCPALDLHGKDARVTVIAWIKRAGTSAWQSIGGVWDESREKRQYFLFVNGSSFTDARTLTRTPVKDRIHGHVSAVGGATPGQKFCVTYASGASPVPLNEWVCVAMSYDGQFSRVYLNGKLDTLEYSNPFPYDKGLFDGGADGADFTVGSNSVKGKPSNFFDGWIGGLAVYNRALSGDELKTLGRVTSK